MSAPSARLTPSGPGENMSFTLPPPYPTVDGGDAGTSAASYGAERHAAHPHPHEAGTFPRPRGTHAPPPTLALPVGGGAP